MKKPASYLWSPEAQVALSKLRTLITSAPIHPDPELELPFIVEVYGLDSAVEAIFSHRTGEHIAASSVCLFFLCLNHQIRRNINLEIFSGN